MIGPSQSGRTRQAYQLRGKQNLPNCVCNVGRCTRLVCLLMSFRLIDIMQALRHNYTLLELADIRIRTLELHLRMTHPASLQVLRVVSIV